jgi:hypothetical protein
MWYLAGLVDERAPQTQGAGDVEVIIHADES